MAINLNGTGSITGLSSISSPTISGGSFPAGTAATPGITLSGDSDTGLYSPGANQIAITTSGTAAVTVDASQRVGIGTSAPQSILNLSSTNPIQTFTRSNSSTVPNGAINFATSDNTVKWQIGTNQAVGVGFEINQGNGTGNALYIDTSNRVGIGTTNPQLSFVCSNGGANGFEIDPTQSTGTVTGINSYNRSSSAFTPLRFNASEHRWDTASTERARIDSSGRLLVGTSSFSGSARAVFQGNNFSSGQPSIVYFLRDSGSSGLTAGAGITYLPFADNAGGVYGQIACEVDGTAGTNDYPGRLVFSTTADGASSPTERMRIGNKGQIYFNTTGAVNTSNFGTVFAISGTSDAPGHIDSFQNVGVTSAVAVIGGNQGYAQIMGDGDLENSNARYTGISDIKFKQNIEDASSQWDDIKAIQVRKYELISNPDRKHIGCVAQELELVCPGLVIDREDREGEPYKSVAYSVLYMKAVKALQEAMQRIEQLEQRLADAGIA